MLPWRRPAATEGAQCCTSSLRVPSPLAAAAGSLRVVQLRVEDASQTASEVARAAYTSPRFMAQMRAAVWGNLGVPHQAARTAPLLQATRLHADTLQGTRCKR